jgi:predicted PurR-regulated permease PerM
MRQYPLIVRLTIVLLFLILAFHVISEAKHILYPIALSVLFSYLLFPVASFMEYKLRFPRLIAVVLAVAMLIAVSTGAINIFINQIQKFAQDETIKQQAIENFAEIQFFIESRYEVTTDKQNVWISEKVRDFFEKSGNVQYIVKRAAGTIEALLFIPIFTIFMLFFRNRAETFIHKLAERRHADLAENIIKEVSKVTMKYVTGVTIVVMILAVVHSTALSLIGIKYAIILGLLTAACSFIPYFGTIVSGIIPVTFVLLAQSDPYLALAVAVYYIIISIIDHNILTPSIVGGQVHLNPFITILSIIIGASVWGIPGMIIVVPFMAVVKIICDNIESLKPFGYLLGADKHGGLSIKKIADFFLMRREKKQ